MIQIVNLKRTCLSAATFWVISGIDGFQQQKFRSLDIRLVRLYRSARSHNSLNLLCNDFPRVSSSSSSSKTLCSTSAGPTKWTEHGAIKAVYSLLWVQLAQYFFFRTVQCKSVQFVVKPTYLSISLDLEQFRLFCSLTHPQTHSLEKRNCLCLDAILYLRHLTGSFL